MWLGIHNGTGWWMAFAGIWMLIFWGPIIASAVWGIINVSRDQNQPARRKDDPESAQNPYAQSEITKEHFEEIKTILKGSAIRN